MKFPNPNHCGEQVQKASSTRNRSHKKEAHTFGMPCQAASSSRLNFSPLLEPCSLALAASAMHLSFGWQCKANARTCHKKKLPRNNAASTCAEENRVMQKPSDCKVVPPYSAQSTRNGGGPRALDQNFLAVGRKDRLREHREKLSAFPTTPGIYPRRRPP